MSAVDDYFTDVLQRIPRLVEQQRGAIDAAADVCARAVMGQRPIYIFDTGHLISHEFIARTGGLAAYTALEFGASVSGDNEWADATRGRSDPSGEESNGLLVDWLFAQGTIVAGDPLIISSVSGTNRLVVELAQRARELGVIVIAVTGVEFSRSLAAQHSSGARLFECADIVLDNEVPSGDSTIAIDGVPEKVAAWSGVAGALLMWAVTVGIVERCAAAGCPATVYTSVNLPGGPAAYEAARERYRTQGR